MESNINVLLTSAGRRVALSSLLLKSIQDLIPHARLVTADQYPSLSAACRIIQDESILPNIREDNYADSLKALVDREAIGLVIPTIDPELNIYSKFKRNRHIEGTQFLISESSLIERCIEKQASELLFSEIGIQTPLQFSEWPGYPVSLDLMKVVAPSMHKWFFRKCNLIGSRRTLEILCSLSI